MNFIVKQAIKSKTGGLTDKFDDLSKKCKEGIADLVPKEKEEKEEVTAATLSEEEQLAQEVRVLKSMVY